MMAKAALGVGSEASRIYAAPLTTFCCQDKSHGGPGSRTEGVSDASSWVELPISAIIFNLCVRTPNTYHRRSGRQTSLFTSVNHELPNSEIHTGEWFSVGSAIRLPSGEFKLPPLSLKRQCDLGSVT